MKMRTCYTCDRSRPVAAFSKYRGRTLRRCKDCNTKPAPDMSTNLALDAWRGPVDRTKNLTAIL